MRLTLRIARLFTTALSIILILGSAVSSAQAKSAHLGGIINAVTLPCHHALGSNDASPMPQSPLDHCRDLCLNQTPDVAIVPAVVMPDATVTKAFTPAHALVPEIVLPARPAQQTVAIAPKLRRSAYPATTRLLI